MTTITTYFMFSRELGIVSIQVQGCIGTVFRIVHSTDPPKGKAKTHWNISGFVMCKQSLRTPVWSPSSTFMQKIPIETTYFLSHSPMTDMASGGPSCLHSPVNNWTCQQSLSVLWLDFKQLTKTNSQLNLLLLFHLLGPTERIGCFGQNAEYFNLKLLSCL